MRLQQLLVVLDPTQEAQPALNRAAWLARHSQAHLDLLLCEFTPALEGALWLDSTRLEQARSDLLAQRRAWAEQLAAPLRAEGLDVSVEVRWGKSVQQTVLDRVAERQPDLVFKASKNHGLLQRLFLSNSCWQLIRKCPVPLWLVHRAEWQGHKLAAALDPMHVADKPAALDHQLIRTGQELAASLGLKAHYLHCYAPLPRTLVFDAELIADYEGYAQRCAQQHRQAFEQLLAPYALQAHQQHLLEGFAEERIPQFVEQSGIDLLLMGAVSRSHLDRALLGNTAERILEAVHCDLLVLKPSQT